MKHKNLVTLIVALYVFCIVVLFLTLTAKAACDEPVRTKKQIALHEAAEILRSAGYADDSAVIKELQAQWWDEQEALDIVARVVQGEAGGCPWMHQVAVAAVVVNRVNSADAVHDGVSERV